MTTVVETEHPTTPVRQRFLRWYRVPPLHGQWRGSSAFRGHGWRLPAAVAGIAVVAAVVSGWNFGHRGYPGFYSDAARSMSLNWRAFFFGTFDPGATITPGRPSGPKCTLRTGGHGGADAVRESHATTALASPISASRVAPDWIRRRGLTS